MTDQPAPEMELIARSTLAGATDEPDLGSRSLRAWTYLRVSTKDQAGRGGEAEGYSLPTQRAACAAKAQALNAVVDDEFCDAGESARSADRPELQRLLAALATDPPDLVIVHKIDRLARNRLDDLAISLALEDAGVQLVSCTEQIDKTPAGKLTHGLMALIAEWYSSNLSAEVKTKTLQKVRNGGTVGKAPIGYLNVRKKEQGREFRTVEIDPQRSPLVQWAFETYAAGDIGIRELADQLAARGLTTVPTAQHIERPLGRSSVHRMLRNRYYIGKFIWGGVEYDGSHTPLVSGDLFAAVQAALDARDQAEEKQRVHNHYLKGSVYCGQCGSRLCITQTTNRHGSTYQYYFCLGRHQRRTPCDQPAIPVDVVEDLVADKWRHVRLAPEYADTLLELVNEGLARYRKQADHEHALATRRLEQLHEERRKLLEAHYQAAVPIDLLRSEQTRLTAEIEHTLERLRATSIRFDQLDNQLRDCLAFLTNCDRAYHQATPTIRRQMNQAVFERFIITRHEIDEATLAKPFTILLNPELAKEPTPDPAQPAQTTTTAAHRNRDWQQGTPAWLHNNQHPARPSETAAEPRRHHHERTARNPHTNSVAKGLKEEHLVETMGLEPTTPCLQTARERPEHRGVFA
jgi:DNA invertase Pin-like site-specific DNA recombinase